MSSKLLTLNKPPPMSEHSELRPIFFMSRGNGVFTPLIPADELPIDMVILGVPRVMSFDKTGGMTSVGEVMASGLHYEVKVSKDADQQCGNRLSPASQPPQVPDTDPVKKPLLTGAGGLPPPFPAHFGTSVVDSPAKPAQATALLPIPPIESSPRTRQNPSFKWPDHQQSDGSDQHSTADKDNDPSPNGDSSGKYNAEPIPKSAELNISRSSSLGDQAVIDAIASTTKTTGRGSSSSRAYKRQGNQGIIRGPLKDDSKTYCSYWVRHGECDYTQQGCRFLHEMPQDREALTKIGLRDFPRWWKELNALNVGTWRHPGRNAKSQSTGSSQPSSLASGISSNTDVTTTDAPETGVVGLRQIGKKRTTGATSDASEQTRVAVTTPPRSSTIQQRPPRTRYRGSPSSTTSSDSSGSSPEASQYSRFIPGSLHPQTRALRVQRLMGLESAPEGGVRVQKDVTEGQKASDSNLGNVAKGDGSILIELEGLSVT